MSSGEEDYNDDGPLSISRVGEDAGAKKRRIQRACDVCRRKKIRCDGAQMPKNRCSNCVAYNFNCTYVEAAKKRGPPKGYVESLENRLEKMEKLLTRLCPNEDFSDELGGRIDREAYSSERGGRALSVMNKSSSPPRSLMSINKSAAQFDPAAAEDLVSSEEERGPIQLPDEIKQLARTGFDGRFHGKSSGLMLIQAARDLKREYAGESGPDNTPIIPRTRRPEFWQPNPWEWLLLQDPDWLQRLEFPPPDLMRILIDAYFRYVNIFFPVFHRPTFENQVRDKLHHREMDFASALLFTCALGARYVTDRRTQLEEYDIRSSGWKYFEQVMRLRKSILAPATLHDLQSIALMAAFLQTTSAPHSGWTAAGIGLRLAQDVGAHRKKPCTPENRLEDQLWKRAFWCLVCVDRGASSSLGRPAALQDEDFDIDFPLEVDDEYWTHPDPERAFKQPDNQPSLIAFFNCYLRLMQISSFVMRTIYTLNKSKVLLGFVGPQWEQHIVAELDSALNNWIDSVPDHLKWDPHRENELYFDQSAILYATYYHVQILVHRPFIPSPRKPSPLSFPSLAICTNAARSCSHVIDYHRKRAPFVLPATIFGAFTSGIVLLISVWGARKTGGLMDPSVQMQDVHRCLKVLEHAEDTWHSAGRLADILRELASVGDLPLPEGSPVPSNNKRERGADEPGTSNSRSQMDSPASSMADASSPLTRPIIKPRSLLSRVSSPASHLSPASPLRRVSDPSALSPNNLPMNELDIDDPPAVPEQSTGGESSAPMNGQRWFPSNGANNAPRALNRQGHDTTPTPIAGPSSQIQPQPYTYPGANPMAFSSTPSEGMYPFPGLSSESGMPGPSPSYDALSAAFQLGAQSSYLASQSAPQSFSQAFAEGDAIALWSSAPASFEWDTWSSYLSDMSPFNTMAQNPMGAQGPYHPEGENNNTNR
ncbi:hypothetical protein BOTBODRAFT_138635 [Botryobasidium botryosum FD-172 SS1]|uniref:Zn(2)-C6 fungal-type domain-containing protein n=1 Tax=Botryobasidium botryosum (strain FD-172 SS1) TaxID=930990 RepID=A0A067MA22_BOTB1|nr:hypothetical protein BOTBODRAFT_138635 [Botryobasidium botryosum FD-172 SS1]